jgi:hypothetical protein
LNCHGSSCKFSFLFCTFFHTLYKVSKKLAVRKWQRFVGVKAIHCSNSVKRHTSLFQGLWPESAEELIVFRIIALAKAVPRVRDRSGNVTKAIAKKLLDEEAEPPLQAKTPQAYNFCNR